jgi:hypothetical protein
MLALRKQQHGSRTPPASCRPGAVEDPAFASGLHVIHAPLPIQLDKVDV